MSYNKFPKVDWVIIDMSNMFYRSFFVHDHVNKHGRDVGAVYGTLRTIKSMAFKHGADNLVAVFDGKDSSAKKKRILSEYKGGRAIPTKLTLFNHLPEQDRKEAAEQNFLWQLRKVAHLTSMLPIKRIALDGYEADEVIGYLSAKMLDDQKKIIVSNDKDYHQLVDDNCSIYNHDLKDVIRKNDMTERWLTDDGRTILSVRCFLGDTGDNIAGIAGTGLSTLNKYFPELFDGTTDVSSMQSILNYLEDQPRTEGKREDGRSKWIRHILEGTDKKSGEPCRQVLKRNWDLMQLHDVDISTDSVLKIENEIFSRQPKFEKKLLLTELSTEGLSFEQQEVQFWDSFNMKSKLSLMEY